jgi:hypothetical protein
MRVVKESQNARNAYTELQQLERLERLQQLERLEQLEHMDWLDFINSIPREILEKSFIYCDPPYEDTAKYQKNGMDYGKFWGWFRSFPYPVYVSSYKAPDDIAPINFDSKIVTLQSSTENRSRKIENIYFNGRGDFQPTMMDMLFNNSVK